MGIHTIRNDTGDTLALLDGDRTLAVLNNGEAVHNIDITITKVIFKERLLSRVSGSFIRDESYRAVYDEAKHQVKFEHTKHDVIFG